MHARWLALVVVVVGGCDSGVAPAPSKQPEPVKAPAQVQPLAHRGLPPYYGRRDVREPWRQAMTRALAGRHDPEIARKPRTETLVGRCMAQVTARPHEEGERSRAEFQHRNGDSWQIELNDSEGAARMVRDRNQPPFVEREKSVGNESLSEEEALRIAAEFVAKNYDVFGLDRDDVMAVEEALVATGPPGPRDAVRFLYELDLEGSRPDPAFRDVPSMNRRWSMRVEVDITGRVVLAMGRNDELDGLKICTTPKLDAKAITSYSNVIVD